MFGRQVSGGFVTGRVSFNGKPVFKAVVVAMSLEGRERSALTDNDGAYLLRDLPSGEYLMTVIHSQYVLDSEVASSDQLLTITDNASKRMDFSLVQGAVISGTFCDTTGKPVVGERVFYEKTDRGVLPFPFMNLRQKIFTDDLGYFRLYGLPSGKYVVGIGKNVGTDLGKLGSPFEATFYPDVNDMARAGVIDLRVGEERDLGKIEVKRARRGFSAGVKFVDENGGPVADFSFDLMKITSSSVGNKTTFRTSGDGFVRIDNLEPSKYEILPAVSRNQPSAIGFAPKSFEISDKDVLDILVTCDVSTVEIAGIVTIGGRVSATTADRTTSGDCVLVLREGEDLVASDKPLYRIELKNGTFHLSGLRKAVYTLVIIPVRRSLHYEYSEIDGTRFVTKQAVGQLLLDLRESSKRVVIQLGVD